MEKEHYVHIKKSKDGRYPIRLAPKDEYTAVIPIGKSAGTTTLYVGVDEKAPFEVLYNGHPLERQIVKKPEGITDEGYWHRHISQMANYVYACKEPVVDNIRPAFVIRNTGSGPISIYWISLQKIFI